MVLVLLVQDVRHVGHVAARTVDRGSETRVGSEDAATGIVFHVVDEVVVEVPDLLLRQVTEALERRAVGPSQDGVEEPLLACRWVPSGRDGGGGDESLDISFDEQKFSHIGARL